MEQLTKTEQFKAIFLDFLADREEALPASDVFLSLRNMGVRISQTTVYRYLYLLEAEGSVEMKRSEEKVKLWKVR